MERVVSAATRFWGLIMIEVIEKETKESIEECFKACESSILIVSPFLSEKTTDMLCDFCSSKTDVECIVVTRLYLNDFLKGVNTLQGVKKLLKAGVSVYALNGLHAKVYLFDDEKVIIGSANFTMAGITKNFEMSIITDEDNVVTKALIIADEIIDYCKENSGVVTEDLLAEMSSDYDKAYVKYQKDAGNCSLKMYGAEAREMRHIKNEQDIQKWKGDEIKSPESDPVFDLFTDNKVVSFEHNVWAKFEGRSDSRQPGDEKPSLSRVMFEGEERYIVNFRNRPSGIQTGDRIFIVALTNDANGKASTIIVGRGIAKAYINKCEVKKEWINKYDWMEYYRYFCEITDLELINQNRADCIPLSQVYDVLGKKTYTSTIEKEEVKNMALCQCRRSHIQMTQDAMKYIDGEIDKRIKKYGLANK